MDRDVKHTDAGELRRFKALSSEDQMVEIWLNGRETNGEVAEVKREIAIERGRIDALELTANDSKRISLENLAVTKFVRKWGAWGTAAILFVVTVGNYAGIWDQVWKVVGR